MMQKAFANAATKTTTLRAKPTMVSTRAFASGTTFERFDFEDPFKLNGLLTDEERAISDAARQFSQEKLMPRVREAYNKETFDIEIMKEMGEQGFLGCTIKEYDLPGVSSTAYGKSPLKLLRQSLNDVAFFREF